MTTPITIPFKGKRSYAQIADIFTHMVAASVKDGGHSLLFTVHAPLLTPFAVVETGPAGTLPTQGFVARLDFLDASGERQQAIALAAPREGDDIPRRPFNEEALREKIALDGSQAHVKEPVENDFAELITAMNKKLLQSLFPQKDAKWWAVRLHLDALQTNWSQVTLTCKTTQPGRLYNTVVSVDSAEVGEISFVSRPI